MTVLTEQTLTQFVAEVSQQHHAMAGAVIATSIAQATALGLACVRISDGAATQQAARLEQIQTELLNLCNEDGNAIATFVALREAGQVLAGQQLLCRAPATMAGLAVETAVILQTFRPLANERIKDDLEMSIRLLTGTAQAALLLLDSNLRIWPEADLLAEFEPTIAELLAQIATLSPVARIRA